MNHTHPQYLEFVGEQIAKKREINTVLSRYGEIYKPDEVAKTQASRDLSAWLAIHDGLVRHESRPFNWMTDRAVGMFDEFNPEPPQLPRCVTCWHTDFPCPSYLDISKHLDKVMG